MRKRNIITAVLLILIVIGGIYFSLRENPAPEKVEQNENSEKPQQQLEEVYFSVYDSDESHRIELETKNLKNFTELKRMELEPVYVEVYNENTDRLLYTMTGESGIYFSDNKILKIRGPVEFDRNNYNIYCMEIEYDLKKDIITGRDNLSISGPGFSSRGKSFQSDLDIENLQILSNDIIKAVIYFEESENEE